MTDTDRATVDGLEALMSSPPKVCRHGNTIDRANGIDCLHCIWARVEPLAPSCRPGAHVGPFQFSKVPGWMLCACGTDIITENLENNRKAIGL